ncbi:MAG: hypothetical protein AB7Q17_08180 [Phycisphaerae bacterium]
MKLDARRNNRGATANRRPDAAQLREQAAGLGHDMRELAATAGQVARRQLDPIEEYVQAQPVRSLLIAAGVGAVLGLVFGRR